MRDVQAETARVTKAYREGRFDEVLELVECMPQRTFDLPCYYLVARIYECGESSRGVDHAKAMELFHLLDRESSSVGSVGVEGLARILSNKDCCANQDLIEKYCLRAIELDGSLPASFILAQMYEQCRGAYGDARKHYLRMFRHGRPLGLRYFARSHVAHGNKLVGALAHVAATLIAPIMFLVNRGAIHPEIR